MKNNELIARDVRKYYGELRVLESLDLSVDPGEFLAVAGPSGCGKSTLLKILAGLESPTAGDVRIGYQPVRGPNSRHLMVFQDPALYPWLTVAENVAFGPRLQHWPTKRVREETRTMLTTVGLGEFADYYPYQISGGMCQRTALARAFIMKPEVLFLDEPFGALDALTRLELQQELIRLWQGTGSTVVLITHDVEEAVYLADRVLVMDSGSGGFVLEVPVAGSRPRQRQSPSFLQDKVTILEALGIR